jgi:glycosyltransferase involved in cell wall biosynthesis
MKNSSKRKLLYLCPVDICQPLVEQLGAVRHCDGFVQCGLDVKLITMATGRGCSLKWSDIAARYGLQNEFSVSRIPTILNSPHPNVTHFRFWAGTGASAMALATYFGPTSFKNGLVVHSRSPVMLAPFLALRSVVPSSRRPAVVLEIHELPISSNGWIVRGSDLILVNSRALKQEVEEVFGCPSDQVLFAPLAPYTPIEPEDRSQARRGLGLPESNPIACYAGNLRDQQGEFLLKTAALLREHVPDALFLIVGGNEEEKAELVARSKDLAVDESVIITGFVEPSLVGRYLSAADVLVHYMSDKLRWFRHCTPAKGWDYQASRRPIVAVGIPLFEEVFGADGERAYRVDERSPEALANGIARAMLNPDASSAMADRASAWIAERTWLDRCRSTLAALDARSRSVDDEKA